MTCQAYPGSGIITLFQMGYTVLGKLVLLPLVPAPTGAGGFFIFIRNTFRKVAARLRLLHPVWILLGFSCCRMWGHSDIFHRIWRAIQFHFALLVLR